MRPTKAYSMKRFLLVSRLINEVSHDVVSAVDGLWRIRMGLSVERLHGPC